LFTSAHVDPEELIKYQFYYVILSEISSLDSNLSAQVALFYCGYADQAGSSGHFSVQEGLLDYINRAC